uniref:Uncharacterized protein n=1 Tax=Heliothis virescens TaxID=7102 RepID=A0A2A4JN45_HELVI
MIGKSSQSTQGEACTCQTGKLCAECKNKKGVRVKVEGSNDLHIPIRISTYKNSTPTTVQWVQKESWNHYQKPAPIESANRGTKLCQWYRRCRARRKLDKLTRLERKRLETVRLEAARRLREAEFLELLKQKEKEIRHAERELESIPKIDYSETEPKKVNTKERKEKPRKIKEKREKAPKIKEKKEKIPKIKAKKEKSPKIKEKKEKSPKIIEKKEKTPKIKEKKPKKTPKEKPVVCYCPDPNCVGFSGYPKVPKNKPRQKIKAAEAKPVSASRYVATKAVKHPKDSVNERFGNFCYRICCQCYCCVTFIMFIGVLIIFIF